ncbi:MAG: M50 family metallopeptidase [Rhodobacterales bacterium]|nr:M50 family metallopeptidase [Rhodobacterales bacterium]
MAFLCCCLPRFISALYIRDFFAVVFTATTAIALLASARYLRQSINDLFLRIIALTSIIYVPYDIFSDTIARSSLRSDAFMLAERFGGSALIWGGIWLVISLIVIGICLRYGLGATSNIRFGKIREDRAR